MNGAKTEPCASINKPPKINIIVIIGASQSFLRIRKKAHNSLINSIVNSILKLILKCVR